MPVRHAKSGSILFGLTLIFLSGSALAQNKAPDARTMQELQGLSSQVMQAASGMVEGTEWKPVVEGRTLIEDTGSYYALTMPHLAFADDSGDRIEVGIIAVNANRAAEPGQWKITVALPTPIVMSTAAGDPVTKVDLGQQNFSGIYSSADKSFPQLNAKYDKVHIDHKPVGLQADIASLAVNGKFLHGSAGDMWAGNSAVNASGITMLFEQTGAVAKIGSLALTGDSNQLSGQMLKALESRLKAAGSGAQSGDPLTALVGLIAQMVKGDSAQAMASMKAGNIDLSIPAQGSDPARKVALAALAASINSAGTGNGNAKAHVISSFSGLHVTPVTQQTQNSTPSDFKLDIDFTNLPVDRIARSGLIESSRADRGEALRQLLSEARTNAVVKDSYVRNNAYSVAVQGNQTANSASPLGMVGNGRIEITGIEALTTAVTQQLKRTDLSPEIRPYMNDLLIALTMMQLTGQQGTAANGKPSRIYDLQTTADGRTLLNGTDMQALMQLVPRNSR